MLTCPACGFDAPDDFAFCPRCATKLAAALAVPEERKLVTTLFCDLVAFTAMSEAADPEDVDALLRTYHAAARKVIESHGGTVEKFIGDAVVGVFGVPVAHEDDPERAVRAGLRLVQALEGMIRPDGSPLEVRIGVDTGEALVRLDVTAGSGEGFLTGDAVNTAARLQALAPPGGLVVGAATRELTAKQLDYAELEPASLKGKAGLVRLWQAQAPRARTGMAAARDFRTPLMGRESELARLRELFAETLASSTSRFALISGEPGVGKSRLVAELFSYIDALPELITWRQGRCLPYGENVTFWALAEIVKAQAGVLDTDDQRVAAEKLEQVVPADADHAWLAERLRPLLGLEASQATREENFTAWGRFLAHLAAGGPVVLVFEDLHWADEGLLDFLEHLAGHADRVPLLIVTTTRPVLFERHAGYLSSIPMARLDLSPLSNDDTRRLVAALLKTEALPAEVSAPILERCAGNPLYAEEYTALLRDRGLLIDSGAEGLALAVGAKLPLPGSVQAVIAARLDALPAESKALLADAAVVGQTFWAGAVAALGEREPAGTERILSSLAGSALIRPVKTSTMAGEREFSFGHVLARDVAYGELPRAARARKHAGFATWLDGKAGERLEDVADVLAHHYVTALDLARAVGEVGLAQSLVEPAVRSLSLAGDRAVNLDMVAAERHYARALELAGAESGQRPRLLVSWAEALRQSSRYREAADALEEAIAGLKAAADIRAAAVAMTGLSRVRTTLGDPGAHKFTLEALALLDGDGPSAEMAAVLYAWGGGLETVKAQHAAAIEVLGRAIAMSEQLGLPQAAQALGMRGAARGNLGDPGGLDDYQRAFAAAEAQGLGPELCQLYFNYASTISTFEGTQAALGAVRKGLELAGRRGLQEYVLYFRAKLCLFLMEAGAWDEALARAAEDVPALEEAEDAWSLVELRSTQALLFARWGEPDKAEPFLAWMVEKGREIASMCLTECLVAAAAVKFRRGETGAALDLLDEWATMPRPDGSPINVERVPEAMRMALAGGNRALAASFVAGMASRVPVEENVLASAHALLAEHRGEHGGAAAGFAAAAARWHEFEVPYEEGHALLGQGRCLVALGRAPEAAAPLAAAREIFARLGAKPALAETEAVLAKIGAAGAT